jgi:hypothetical protein
MKHLVFATLLLACSASFAQSAAPSTASPETDIGRTIGRSMGTLPVIQDACGGYSAQDKGALNAGLAGLAIQLAASRGPEFGDSYQKGFQEGQTLMKNQVSHLPADRLSSLCKEFNDKYPELAANLKKAELKAQAK